MIRIIATLLMKILKTMQKSSEEKGTNHLFARTSQQSPLNFGKARIKMRKKSL